MNEEKFAIRVESRFEAAHHLRSYYGAPEKLHGHSWRVEVKIEASELDSEELSIDYVKVQRALDELASRLDHDYINEIPPFDRLSPTSENIARWFYEAMNRRELLGDARVQEVTVWEGPSNSVTYRLESAPEEGFLTGRGESSLETRGPSEPRKD